MKYVSLFSGGGGADIGAMQAGFTPVAANEYDPAIAEVYTQNIGMHVRVGDILEQDPHDYPPCDLLHASPPCPNFSVAKAGACEQPHDIALADKVVEFIEVLRPRWFTLENVMAYRKSQSFALITAQLTRLGYFWDWENLNSADYGGVTLCPLHDLKNNARNAKRDSCQDSVALAPDIVAVLAMMRSEDQARHLATDAAENLVKAISRDTVVNAAWQSLESTDKKERLTRIGKAESALTNAGMSVLESMASIDVSIALLLRTCLAAPLISMRLSTIETETLRTILLIILSCLKTTANTRRSTTPNAEKETCPLCKFKAVPQTRRRLVLRACLGGLLRPLPAPVPWVGWYKAIEDLILTLPESHFANWQLARLPKELGVSALLNNHFAEPEGYTVNSRAVDEPAQIVTVLNPMWTFIMQTQGEGGDGIRNSDEPMQSVTAAHGAAKFRAFIVGGANTSDEQAAPGVGVSELDEPTRCVQQSARQWKAFIVDDQNPGTPNDDGERGLTIRQQGEPMHTVSATQTKRSVRAWLVESRNSNQEYGDGLRQDEEPATTVTTDHKPSHQSLAWLSQGRVVAMTPRCLARFQSFPDWYVLPDKNALACRIIGNAVPPLMYNAIAKTFLDDMK